jgi:hypothetical protein
MLTRSAMRTSGPENVVLRLMTWMAFFFTSFFGGFFIVGYINIATDLPVVDSLYASVVALVVFMGFGLWLATNRMPGLVKEGGNAGRSHNFVIQLFLPGNGLSRTLATASIVIFVLIALMLSAGFPRGYEAQAYHLPIAVHIFQAHSLKVWKVWKTVFFHAYPANASIYFGFLLGLTSEHLVAPAGLVFLIPLAVAAYGIGRATGADETASLLSALGLITIPILVAPAFDAVADVGGVAFLAIAIYFAVARPTRRPWDLVLSGLAAGLAFGFKSLHLVGIAFLFLVILLQAWSKPLKHTAVERLWSTIHPLSIFLSSTFATSGFWLVRNYAQLGNPLYPVHLRIFEIFGWTKGDLPYNPQTQLIWVRSSAEWLVYPWVEWLRPGENVFSKHGLGPFFAATVPVACLTALIGVLKRETKTWPVTFALLGGGLCVLAVWWILDDRQPRYFIGALVFLVPLVAWTMAQATGFSRRVFESIVAVCISSALLMTFSLQLIDFGTRFIYGKQFTRSGFYEYPEMLDRLPPESTVVNLGHRTRNYALFGSTHQNRVIVYTEALSALQASLEGHNPDEAPQLVPLSHLVLHKIGATHLLTEGYPKLIPDECVALQKINSLDKDTLGNLLSSPISLYEIKFCN